MDIFQRFGPSELARMVGCKPPSVIEWRQRGVPPDRCPSIERMTGGEFTCERLRPDVRWVRMPDTQWPWHVDGRPLIDPTADAPSAELAKAA